MFCLRVYRLSRWLFLRRVPLLPYLLKAVNRIVFSVVLPPQADISPRAVIGYEGLGSVVHRDAVIEDDVVLGPGITIGGRAGRQGAPRICKGAMIGSGAAILGPIVIGAHASIGSNAVVMTDIPPYGVAVGVPARVVRINKPEEMPQYKKN